MGAGSWARWRPSSTAAFPIRRGPPYCGACWNLARSPPPTPTAILKPRRLKRPSASTATTRSTATTSKPEPPEMDGEDGDPLWDVAGQVGHSLDRYVTDLEPGSVRVL